MIDIDKFIDPSYLHYKQRIDPKKNCLDAAMSYGFDVFALQDGGQCFGSDNMRSYKKYNISDKCVDKEGGSLANYVYEIETGKL